MDKERSLRRRILEANATNLILVFFIVGLVGILLPTFISGDSTAEHIARDIGIAILTAAVLGVGYEYKLREDFVENTTERLKKVLNEHDDEVVNNLEQFRRSGLVQVHETLPYALLVENVTKPSPRIRVLQTWTGFRDQGFMNLLCEAAQREGCNVQVLLLDPLSDQVRYRANAMSTVDEGDARNAIVGDLRELSRLRSKLSGENGIEVKVYDAHPAIHLYDFYHTKFMGTHWRETRSIFGPQFEIHGPESLLSHKLDSHFDSLWKDRDHTRDAQEALAEYDLRYVGKRVDANGSGSTVPES